jgi:hypothetical protein
VTEALIARLLETSGVSALVANRVWPGVVPQGSPLPAVVVNLISGAPEYTDDGETDISSARVQVDAWALTFDAAKAVSRATKAALSGFAGTQDAVTFHFVMIDTERDDREPGSNAAQYRFRTSVDFIVWHST